MRRPTGKLLLKLRFFVRSFQDKPKAWGGHRTGKTGRGRFVSTDEKSVRQEILAAALHEARKRNVEHILKTPCDIVFRVGVFFRRPKKWWAGMEPAVKPDCSNYIKLVEDSLNKWAWTDDAAIIDTSATKVYWDYPGYLVLIWYYEKVPKPGRISRKKSSI